VVVELWSDQLQRLSPGSVLTRGTDPDAGTLRVVSSKPFGAAGRFLVTFEGVGDRDAAERLRGADLWAPPIDVPGALWVHELVGAAVRDAAGDVVGTVAAVEANPASDLLVLDSGALIPVRFVTGHDAAAGVVEVDIPEGLLDL
jgi:16S rRNA processing protein RimM